MLSASLCFECGSDRGLCSAGQEAMLNCAEGNWIQFVRVNSALPGFSRSCSAHGWILAYPFHCL